MGAENTCFRADTVDPALPDKMTVQLVRLLRELSVHEIRPPSVRSIGK